MAALEWKIGDDQEFKIKSVAESVSSIFWSAPLLLFIRSRSSWAYACAQKEIQWWRVSTVAEHADDIINLESDPLWILNGNLNQNALSDLGLN